MPLIDPKKRITVGPDENGNYFYLRAKMDIATKTAVIAEYGRLSRGLGIVPDAAYELSLIRNNLRSWTGPDYMDADGKVLPCNPITIGQLDPDDSLFRQALAAINEANKRPEAPEPPPGDEDEVVRTQAVEADAAPNE
jgi:hypothetical protein